MARAFIMINVAPGHVESLQGSIQAMEMVLTAHIVAGEHDLIIEAEAADVNSLIRSVVTEIRSNVDVVDTKTYICLE